MAGLAGDAVSPIYMYNESYIEQTNPKHGMHVKHINHSRI